MSFFSSSHKAEKKDALIGEAESYIAAIKNQKQLPQISSDALFLASGEHAFLEEQVILKETRAVRKSSGGFGGLRIMKGVTIGGWSGTSESHQEWRQLDSGQLVLTNKKIIFRGGKENRTIPIDKIVAFETYSDRVEIVIDGRTKNIAFSVKNPLIWKIAISIIKNAKDPLDLGNTNLNVEVR